MSAPPPPRRGRGGLLPGAAAVLWLAAALWVFAHPFLPGSDDALFLLRGLTRFSLLDLSPQFPGYPGLIAMGRALCGLGLAPTAALGGLTAGLALSLPLLAGLIAARFGAGAQVPPQQSARQAARQAAALAAIFALMQPLFPGLALAMLSDGAGLAFALAGLAALPRTATERAAPGWALLAGAGLGWALACRPTNLALALGIAAAAFAICPRRLWPIWPGGAAIVLPSAAALVLHEPLIWAEAARFVQGHALIWGNTAFSDQPHRGWGTVLAAQPALALVLGALTLAVIALPLARETPGATGRAALKGGFVAHALWVALFQNPESLRHLAPLLVLGGVAAALLLARPRADAPRARLAAPRARLAATAGLIALCLAAHLSATRLAPASLPPLEQAARYLEARPDRAGAVLATNHGVQLLRARLPDIAVQDRHYPGASALALGLARGPGWRLNSTPETDRPAEALFAPRFPGEPALWLFREARGIARN